LKMRADVGSERKANKVESLNVSKIGEQGSVISKGKVSGSTNKKKPNNSAGKYSLENSFQKLTDSCVNFQKELKKKEQMQRYLKNGIDTNNSSSLGGIKGKSGESTPSFKKSGEIKKKMAQAIFNSINRLTNKTPLVRKSAAKEGKNEP
jgi:hypothetical protein